MRIKIENGKLKFVVKVKSEQKSLSEKIKEMLTTRNILDFVFGKLPFVLLLVLVPVLTFITFFTTINYENDVFRVYLLLVGISTMLFFAQFLLGRRSIFIDPNGLTGVLVFNLLLTSTVILNTSDRVSSTYATPFFRSGSGIALISFIALFYILSYFTKRFHSVFDSRLFRISVLITYSVSLVDILISTSFMSVIDLLYVVLGGLLVFSLYRNKFAKGTYEKAFAVLAAIVVFIKLASGSHSVKYGNFLLLFAFTYLFIVAIQIFKRRKNLKDYKRLNPIAIFPVFTLLWIIIHFIKEKAALSGFVNEFVKLFNQFNVITEGNLTGENTHFLLIGRGSDFLLQSNAFASNILVSSGLIGFFGYLTMWLINIVLSSRLFRKQESSLNTFKLFYTTMFFLMSFFINVPLLFTVIWWIIFVDNAVLFSKNKNEIEESNYRFLSFPKVTNKNVNKVINVILFVLFLIMCGILVSFITRNII